MKKQTLIVDKRHYLLWITDDMEREYLGDIIDALNSSDACYTLTLDELWDRTGYIPRNLVMNWDELLLTPKESEEEEIERLQNFEVEFK